VATGSWIGRPLARKEDPRLLTGRGRFVADLQLPGTLEMVVVRSPHGHARLRRVDAGDVGDAAMVLTAAALDGRVGEIPMHWLLPGMKCASFPILAAERVRYVGQPVAALVATDRYVGEDLAERVVVDYEPLPAIVDVEEALRAEAPLLYPEWGDNVAYQWSSAHGDVAAAFRHADVVVRHRACYPRHTGLPIETRGVLARYDVATGELTVWLATQTGHRVRTVLAEALRFPEERLRVVVPDVGGAFGTKLQIYPEEALACLFALKTGRPIRWIEDRREHFLATVHAREQRIDLELAARHDGTLLAVRARVLADVGAHPHSRGVGASFITTAAIPGPYRIGAYQVELRGVVTNKVPFGAYRGFGKPQAVFAMERAVDALAARLGLDPAAVRERNLVRPDEMPFPNPAGHGQLDSGDYPAALRRALQAIDWEGHRAAHADLRRQGKLRGLGLACFVEATGMPSAQPGRPTRLYSAYETAVVSIDPSGGVTLASGLLPSGQGHETALAQVCAAQLGVSPADVRVIVGDTAHTPYSGFGTAASRGMSTGGSAALLAARQVREKVLRLGGHLLEAAPADLDLVEGEIVVRGSPERRLTLAEVARQAFLAANLPPGMEPELQARVTFDLAQSPYAYGVNACEVEIDRETGAIAVLRYVVVDDCGTVVNPAIVDGQVQGGLAQGFGGTLLEELRYDANGQLLTGSLLDYLVPTACDLPPLHLEHLETPSPLTPGGFKGVGESGTVGVPAAVANAVLAALGLADLTELALPLTPERVLALVGRASRHAPAVETTET